ncbi:hypothetical protein [Pseudooceanicola sp.]|uniref:hypothetical protein n=1 Tax=Pseudooceanicola sp. TaxID=1914328 RepID=UPI0035C70A71
MTRKLIATIVAAALAVTSVNVGTAQAADRDVARIIVGATALAIIGSALAAEQRKKNQVTTYTTRPHNQGYRQHYGNNHHNKPHWKKQQHRRTVSRECLMSVRGQRGWTEGYAVRCAQRTTRATLPSDCVRRNYAQGPRLFYSPHCLRRNGFNA